MRASIVLLVFCSAASLTQANVDEKPPIKGKYWLYNHLIDKQELEYVRRYYLDFSSLPAFAETNDRVAQEITGVKTVAISNDHFLIESDTLTVADLKHIGQYLEVTHRVLANLINADSLGGEIGFKRFSMLLLKKGSAHTVANNFGYSVEDQDLVSAPLPPCWKRRENRVMERLYGLCDEVTPPTDLLRFALLVADSYATQILWTLFPVSEWEFSSFFHRIPRLLNGALMVQIGANWVTGTYNPDGTAQGESTPGNPPDWIVQMYNFDSPSHKKRADYALRSIIEGGFDMDADTSLKLWAFCDWLILAKCDSLKSFLKCMREFVTEAMQKKETLSTEKTKRAVINALEKSFGKSIDEIEKAFQDYVRERYFDAKTAKTLEKCNLRKPPAFWEEKKDEKK